MSDFDLIMLADKALDLRLADCATVDEDFDSFEPVEITEYLNSYERENNYAFG
jgi:hypothetical protein